MRQLTRQEDPTGFFSMLRMIASDRFGNPRGFIEGHGRYGHPTKSGPGRRHMEGKREHWATGSKGLNSRTARRGR